MAGGGDEVEVLQRLAGRGHDAGTAARGVDEQDVGRGRGVGPRDREPGAVGRPARHGEEVGDPAAQLGGQADRVPEGAVDVVDGEAARAVVVGHHQQRLAVRGQACGDVVLVVGHQPGQLAVADVEPGDAEVVAPGVRGDHRGLTPGQPLRSEVAGVLAGVGELGGRVAGEQQDLRAQRRAAGSRHQRAGCRRGSPRRRRPSRRRRRARSRCRPGRGGRRGRSRRRCAGSSCRRPRRSGGPRRDRGCTPGRARAGRARPRRRARSRRPGRAARAGHARRRRRRGRRRRAACPAGTARGRRPDRAVRGTRVPSGRSSTSCTVPDPSYPARMRPWASTSNARQVVTSRRRCSRSVVSSIGRQPACPRAPRRPRARG